MTDKSIHIVFQVMNFVFGSSPLNKQLLPIDRLLLLAFAKHKGPKGIYPSQATLAKEVQISTRHLIDRLNYLEKINVIGIDRLSGRSNHYHLEFLSTTPEPQFTGEPQFTSEPQFTPPVNPSSPNPCTAVHPISKEDQQRVIKTERALSIFEPDEANRVLAMELSSNLDEQVTRFTEIKPRKYQTQAEFREWLKKDSSYRRNQQSKTNAEPRCTLQFFELSEPAPERPVFTEAQKVELERIRRQLHGGLPNGRCGDTRNNHGG